MLAEKVDRWIEEYKKEGRVEGMAAVFRWMKDFGMSVAEIAKVTGFSEDEITKMINNKNQGMFLLKLLRNLPSGLRV